MLHDSWVTKIFERLQGVYGSEFTFKFSRVVDGQDVGFLAAKQAWAEELAFCADKPELIAWAFKNLPEKAPNAIQFKMLCKGAPRVEKQESAAENAIEASYTPEQIEENKAKLREMTKAMKNKIFVTKH